MRRSELEDMGFTGFRVVVEALNGWIESVPREPGVYAVLRTERGEPSFLSQSKGGHFKGRDPTVPVAGLQEKWVDATDLLYVGKADDLGVRIKDLCGYGLGEPIGHWGGRYLWQVKDHHSFTVAWRRTPNRDPFDVEAELMNDFRSLFGSWPFANIASPRRKRR